IKMITKEEYSALYYISMGRNSIERLSEDLEDKKKTINLIKDLERKGLLKIELRDNKIYSLMETKDGSKLLKSKKYKSWFEELGD
ncbi:MAG: hypothetical protein WCK29_01895, partial [archaeon]